MEQILNHQTVVAVLAIIGGMRVIFKPLMTYVESHVYATKTKADDKSLAKIKSSIWYKAFAFLLNYTASIKLPK